MKYLYITIIFFFIISCNNDENIKIINQNLVLEIKSFINDVDNNSFCKSDHITVEISKRKIRMGNYKPEFTENYIGKIKMGKSKVYFFSSIDYSDFILVKKSFEPLDINDNIGTNCDPPMYKILIIDKNDKNKFYYLPPPKLNRR